MHKTDDSMYARALCLYAQHSMSAIHRLHYIQPANKNRIQQIYMEKHTQQQPEHNWAKKLPTHQQQQQLENIV